MKTYVCVEYGSHWSLKNLIVFESREAVNLWIRESYNAAVRKFVHEGSKPSQTMEEFAKMIWDNNIHFLDVLTIDKIKRDAKENEEMYKRMNELFREARERYAEFLAYHNDIMPAFFAAYEMAKDDLAQMEEDAYWDWESGNWYDDSCAVALDEYIESKKY